MEKNKILIGTELKMLIEWEYPSNPSLTLDNVDFIVEFFAARRSRTATFYKPDLVREETPVEGGEPIVNWYAYVDTAIIGTGSPTMKFTVDIPDTKAPGGIKREVYEVKDETIIIYE